jgi:hypothetical protein
LLGYLSEFFSMYDREESGVPFVSSGVRTLRTTDGTRTLQSQIRLPPLTAGIAQTISLEFSAQEDKWYPVLRIHRTAGPYYQWTNLNWRFVDSIRKQFLIFRSLGVDAREEYHRKQKTSGEKVNQND